MSMLTCLHFYNTAILRMIYCIYVIFQFQANHANLSNHVSLEKHETLKTTWRLLIDIEGKLKGP